MNVIVKDTINKPIDQVFDAILNPEKITKYFASHTVGDLIPGKKVIWKFEDVGAQLEVAVLKIEKDRLFSFEWMASGKLARVDIQLEMKSSNQTTIEIVESAFQFNEDEVQKVIQQTQGWTDFICSLKAYLYTGINLRNGQMAG